MPITFPTTKLTKDEIRNAIGQLVTFVIRGNPTSCPVCSGLDYYDEVNEVSLDPYCTVCSGAYWVTSDTISGVIAHVRWRCVHPDTEIITNCGIVKACDVTIGSMVLSGDGNYHEVTDVIFNNVGAAYKVTTLGNEPIIVSNNHPFLAVKSYRLSKKCGARKVVNTPAWVVAEEITTDHYLAFPRPNLEELPKILDYISLVDVPHCKWEVRNESIIIKTNKGIRSHPRYIEINDQLLEIFGWYLAEGSFSNGTVAFSLHKKEQDVAKYIGDTLCTIFNIDHYNIIVRGNNCELYVSSTYLGKLFDALLGRGAHCKRIHPLLLKRGVLSMFKGYAFGDGYIENNRLSIDTVSKTLAYQWKVVLAAHGIFLKTYVLKHSKYRQQLDSVDCELLYGIWGWDYSATKKRKNSVFRDDKFYYVKVKKIESVLIDCPFTDLTIKQSPSFVGNGVLLHNTQDQPDMMVGGETFDGDCFVTIDINALSASNIVKIKEVIVDSRKLQIYRAIYRGVPSRDRIRFVCREFGKE